jgi:hypothetical protein
MFNKSDSLYTALVDERFEEARIYIKQGQTIPDILYYQATGHDNDRIISFLLEQVSEKQNYIIRLSVSQGAINCLKSFKEKGLFLEDSLLSIEPRKNKEQTMQYLREILKHEPASTITNNRVKSF